MRPTLDTQTFLDEHQLPRSYAQLMQEHFRPLAERIALQAEPLNHPLVVGINGCQGSGKSTLAQALAWLLKHEHQASSCIMSLDDFYLTQAERQQLDLDVHPLLAQRGVPGTHDTRMATRLLSLLKDGQCPVDIPRFSKADDERAPADQWQRVSTTPDIVILEGWCLGVGAQNFLDLIEPINDLERQEDRDGIWRHFVNTQLQQHYQPLFKLIDSMTMLKAPSFDCVHRWRVEQEEKLRGSLSADDGRSGLMTSEQIGRFIQHFQRLTEHALETLPETVDCLLELDQQRHITRCTIR